MLRRSARMGRADGGTKMKALVIGVVLVFLGGCASHVSPGGKAIESPIKEYFGQDPIERRAFGERERRRGRGFATAFPPDALNGRPGRLTGRAEVVSSVFNTE